MIRDVRLKYKNPSPYLFEELKLSYNFSHSCTGELFYRYGPGNYNNLEVCDNMLLFFSNSMINKLNENHVWAVDGTFQVVPRPFYQLFTISYLNNNHVFPVVFALLKNKTHETYSKIYQILRRIIPLNMPNTIKTDFEQASISALRDNFPDSRISACQFHLAQSLFRKIQTIGL